MKIFLESNLSLILILLATVVGLAALGLTPREEDPQIVVPLADVYVNFPGHSAAEVEQLVTTPLEKMLYQIDGVEYVYSMSREGQAIITVRYYVGEDRERSLVKLYKKIDENLDLVPPGVTGWVVKPVEIDDVPIVTLTLTGASTDDMTLRRVARGNRPAAGGRDRRVAGLRRRRAAAGRAGASGPGRDGGASRLAAGSAAGHPRGQRAARRQAISAPATGCSASRPGEPFENASQLRDLVIGVFDGQLVFLKDVAQVDDGPEEIEQLRAARLGAGAGIHEAREFSRARWWASRPRLRRRRRAARSVATGRHHRHRQEERLQRRLGRQRRAAAGRRAAQHDRARQTWNWSSPATTVSRPTRRSTSWSKAWRSPS